MRMWMRLWVRMWMMVVVDERRRREGDGGSCGCVDDVEDDEFL